MARATRTAAPSEAAPSSRTAPPRRARAERDGRRSIRRWLFELPGLALAALCGACGGTPTSATGPSDAPESEEIRQDAPDGLPDGPSAAGVTLEASLRERSDRRLVVDYTLVNATDAAIVALDDSPRLQIERTEGGGVRLLKGKQDTGDYTSFYVTPTIEGRSVAPGESVRGSGSRALPLTLDYPLDHELGQDIDPAIDTVELCIGHGPVDELVPTRRTDGTYTLNADLELQRLACTTLELAAAPPGGTDPASPLADDAWELTLERALETVGGAAREVALGAALTLRLPEVPEEAGTSGWSVDGIVHFTLSDGTPGTQVSARCEGGGGFTVVRTAASFGVDTVTADGCAIDPWTIDGRVVHEMADSQGVAGTRVTFEDFEVDDGARRVRLSVGTHAEDDGHPAREAAWSETSYRVDGGGEARTVTDLGIEDVAFSGTAFDRTLSVRFDVTAPWTNGSPLSVSTPVPFTGLATSESGRDFTRGALVLETGSGDRLRLDADGGRPGEVLITLERAGAVTSVYRPWPEALRGMP